MIGNKTLNKIRTNKAQTEIIGLVVIVILITLGMLFMAAFFLNDNHEKKIFTRKGLATSTLDAAFKTTIKPEENCAREVEFSPNNPQLGSKILQDCAEYYQNSPEGYSVYVCRERHSCEFFNSQMTEFLNQTLGQWGKNYIFTSRLITLAGTSTVELSTIVSQKGGCPKTKERDSSGLFPLSSSAGLIESELLVCD